MTSEDEPKESKPTVLVAEDSLPNRKILCHLLSKLGFDVIAAEDGKKAWEQLNNPDIEKPVAIFSDIMMPEENGLQFLKKVRGSEEFKEIPFVLATAVNEKNLILKAKNLGVNGYILKPITLKRITAKVEELFPEMDFTQKLAG